MGQGTRHERSRRAGGSRESNGPTRKRILDAGARAFRRDGTPRPRSKTSPLAGLQRAASTITGSKEEIVEEVLEVGVEGVSARPQAVAALGPEPIRWYA
jgi:hypothetical protein